MGGVDVVAGGFVIRMGVDDIAKGVTTFHRRGSSEIWFSFTRAESPGAFWCIMALHLVFALGIWFYAVKTLRDAVRKGKASL